MAEIDLMADYPKCRRRPIRSRALMKFRRKSNVDIALDHALAKRVAEFGYEYFDGDRLLGYGGYYYHPKYWTKTARRFIQHYGLKAGSRVLDVGCAKGFLLYDLHRLCPGLEVAGLDISQYAIDNAKSEVKPWLSQGTATTLPFEDRSFDLVVSISTLSHLDREGCAQSLREITRVSKGARFITLHAWETEEQHARIVMWNLAAQTYMHVAAWREFLQKVPYHGDYYWWIA